MSYCLLLTTGLLLGAAQAGDDPVAPIAPFVDEQTVAVVRVELSRLDPDAQFQKAIALGKLQDRDLAQARQEATRVYKSLRGAGIDTAYLVVSMADLPGNPPFVVIPLAAGADAAKVADGWNATRPLSELPAEKLG